MNIFEWAEKHQHITHGGIGFGFGFLGTLYALSLGAPWWRSAINGFAGSVIWFTAKEATDDTCHHRLVNLDLKGVWEGWSWSDYLVGLLGGILGAATAVLICIL